MLLLMIFVWALSHVGTIYYNIQSKYNYLISSITHVPSKNLPASLVYAYSPYFILDSVYIKGVASVNLNFW